MAMEGAGRCLSCGTPTRAVSCPGCGGMVVFRHGDDEGSAMPVAPEQGWSGCRAHSEGREVDGCDLAISDEGVWVGDGRGQVLWWWPLEDLTAVAVDDAAGIRARVTVTRVLLFGGLGLLAPKRTDVTYVTIEGPGEIVVVEVPGVAPAVLRAQFREALGPAHPLVAASAGDAVPAGEGGAPESHPVEARLRALARLHADGLVDDAEFAAKRSELLDQL